MSMILDLVNELNKYNELYEAGTPIISDKAYDTLYFKLKQLEEETGIIYSNSPTQTIGYEVKSSLEKVQHNHDMLSLDKTKDLKEVQDFLGDFPFVAMLKMDGLTCSLHYSNGELVSAETRGNGIIGELVTHNAKVISSVPKKIPVLDEVIVDGEVIITYNDFKDFENTYKNPRNFASGSIRLLDAKECARRHLTFVAWDEITNTSNAIYFHEKLDYLHTLGFTVVPNIIENSVEEKDIEFLKKEAECLNYPIDGIVYKFNDIAYGNSLGKTSHHMRSAIAFKFYDEMYDTTLQDIEWSMGRTGQITPIAVFDDIDFGDSIVNRASLHNLSIINTLFGEIGPCKGQTIRVSKRNMIIPCIEEVDIAPEDTEKINIPTACPCCGKPVEQKTDYESTFLYCNNSDCPGKIINRIDFFVGKKGLDIKGLSKATLEKLINWGWINGCGDVFTLSAHRDEWVKKPGFGVASVDKVLKAIEASSVCELDKFICAIGIPLIGSTASKQLAKCFKDWNTFMDAVDNDYKFYQLSGFGREMHQAIINFDYSEARYIAHNFITFKEKVFSTSTGLEGKTFVITGKLMSMNRDSFKEKIEELGGKVVGSVSSKTDYLINNDIESTSSKNMTAKKLGIPVITEKDFFNLIEN